MISICMITKNESDKLDKCLSAIKKADKNNKLEIVVVDTGSTDNSIATAKKYTDKVYEFEWCNDFSAARNYSIEKAEGEYILVIDSDEYIEKMDVDKLELLAKRHCREVGRIERINEFVRNGETVRFTERISRIFSKELYGYKGRIHEQVTLKSELLKVDKLQYSEQVKKSEASLMEKVETPERMEGSENGLSEKENFSDVGGSVIMYNAPVTIIHSGYAGSLEDRKKKSERNRQLLLMDLEEYGDDPYTLYQLGKCYYMEENYLEACEYFGRGLGFDLSPKLEYVQDMVESYGYALVNSKNAIAARDILGDEQVYEAFAGSGDFCFMMGLVYMNCQDFDRAVQEFLKAVNKSAKVEGVNSYKAYYNAGVIYECLGMKKEAVELYGKCGGYVPALKRLSLMQ